MFGFIDPLFLILVAPAFLLALWAQARVHSAFASAGKVPSARGLNGAAAARAILQAHGLNQVRVEQSHGFLSDHYDPRAKVLRLSPQVYEGRNLAALGVAAHEAGHAIQDKVRYAPLALRNGLVPAAMAGGWLSGLFLMGGILLMMLSQSIGGAVLLIGIGLFALTVVFQIVNLPVEFDASRRAKLALAELGMVTGHEMPHVSRVLSAAAMTYVAATLMAIMQLLYFLLRFGPLARDE